MTTSALSYLRYDSWTAATNVTESLIDAFCEVFAGPPWNEKWERNDVRSILHQDTVAPATSWIAMDGGTVVGFAWGYPVEAARLEEKLGVRFADTLAAASGMPHATIERANRLEVFYQANLGVLPAYQGKGIASVLFERRFALGISTPRLFVVRTRELPEPSVTYGWYRDKLGYDILARYPREDGRVLLVTSANALSGRLHARRSIR